MGTSQHSCAYFMPYPPHDDSNKQPRKNNKVAMHFQKVSTRRSLSPEVEPIGILHAFTSEPITVRKYLTNLEIQGVFNKETIVLKQYKKAAFAIPKCPTEYPMNISQYFATELEEWSKSPET